MKAKKFLAIMLCILLLGSLITVSAFAVEDAEDASAAQAEAVWEEGYAEAVPEIIPEAVPETVPVIAETVPEPIYEYVPETVPEPVQEYWPEADPEPVQETVPETVPEPVQEIVPETTQEIIAETVADVNPDAEAEVAEEPETENNEANPETVPAGQDNTGNADKQDKSDDSGKKTTDDKTDTDEQDTDDKSGLINEIPVEDSGYVYMAGIRWHVIGISEKECLLISDELLLYEEKALDFEGAGKYCDALYEVFSEPEQKAVLETTKEDSDYSYKDPSSEQTIKYSAAPLKEAKLFMLSAEEAATYFKEDKDREPGYWWLRSPSAEDETKSGVVLKGSIGLGDIKNKDYFGVRPAFRLSIESIVFPSAAKGAKSSEAAGNGKFGSFNAVSEDGCKITILDSSRDVFTASADTTTVQPGGTVSIQYSNAGTGTGEYVSAVIADEKDNILYYASLTSETGSGTWEMTLPDLTIGGIYTLKVFSEQQNGDYLTDYASSPKVFQLTVAAEPAEEFSVTVTDNGCGKGYASLASGPSGTKVTLTAKANSGYELGEWQVISGGVTITENEFTIGEEDVVIKAVFDKIGYTVVSVSKSTWTKGTSDTVKITVERNIDNDTCFQHFTGVKIDNKALSSGDYSAKSGSAAVTLKAATLEKLSAGSHTVTISFDDGSAETKITIKEAEQSDDNKEGRGSGRSGSSDNSGSSRGSSNSGDSSGSSSSNRSSNSGSSRNSNNSGDSSGSRNSNRNGSSRRSEDSESDEESGESGGSQGGGSQGGGGQEFGTYSEVAESAGVIIEDGAVTYTENWNGTVSGDITAEGMKGAKITANEANGVAITLPAESDIYVIEDSEITASAGQKNNDLGYEAAFGVGIGVETGELWIRNSRISSTGPRSTPVYMFGTAQPEGTSLVVIDSAISSYTDDLWMPPFKLLAGGSRATLLMTRNNSWFINSTVTSNNWGAISQDSVEANTYVINSQGISKMGGYGAYLTYNMYLYASQLYGGQYGAFLCGTSLLKTGTAEDALADKDAMSKTPDYVPNDQQTVIAGAVNAVVVHTSTPGVDKIAVGNFRDAVLSTMPDDLRGSVTPIAIDDEFFINKEMDDYGISSGTAYFYNKNLYGSLILVRSMNTDFTFDNTDARPFNGVLVQTVLNYDPPQAIGYLSAGEGGELPGTTVTFLNGEYTGDILHQDYQHLMNVIIGENGTLKGAIVSGTYQGWNDLWTEEDLMSYLEEDGYEKVPFEDEDWVKNVQENLTLEDDEEYAETENLGAAVTVEAGGTWIVTGTSSLSSLTIEEGAEVAAPEGTALTVFINANASNALSSYEGGIQISELTAGTYENVIITVS